MERKTLLVLSVILLAGFTLRMFPVNTGHHYWDETVYLQQGEIIAGESPNNYNEFDFRPPLFSFLIAPSFLLPGSLIFVHLTVALLSTLGVLATFWLGREMFDTATGLLSSLAYASSPVVALTSHDVLVDPVLPLFWISAAFFSYRSIKGGWKNYVLAGVSVGLAVLTKFTSFVLLPAVLTVFFLDSWNYRSPVGNLRDFVHEKRSYVFLSGFLGVFLPYLGWSYLAFGSPLHTLETAWMLSGAADPFLRYLMNAHMVLLAVFFLGLGVSLVLTRNWKKPEYYLSGVFILSLLVPLQFLIANREVRFITPVVPFLSILSAAGLSELGDRLGDHFPVFLASLLFLSLVPLGMEAAMSNPTPLVKNDTSPVPHTAAAWLKANTEDAGVVYADDDWPIVAYHLKRDMVVVPEEYALEGSMAEVFERPGYLYHSRKAARAGEVEEFIQRSGSFELVKTFGDNVQIYYYRG